HPDNEPLIVAIAEHAEKQAPQPREIDRQQRQDGAELDQHIEAFAERFVVETEKMADQQKMTGRRYRNEFGQAFDDAEEDRLDQIQCHVGSAMERLGGIAASAVRLRGTARKAVTIIRVLPRPLLTRAKPASRVFS